MTYVVYFLGGAFFVIALAMFFAYYRSRHFGLFIMATTYAASGLLAISLPHWWPLVTGFALVWVLKYLGLEPQVRYIDKEEAAELKAEGERRKTEGKSESSGT
jgi:hypothetical protein